MTGTLTSTPPVDAYRPLEPPVHHEPQRVADGVYVIRQLQGEGQAPIAVYINSVVIDGAEPIIVDTGTRANRRAWLDDVFSIVSPERVRWIFLTHDDVDHTGNLIEVLERCPNATLLASWFITERLTPEYNLPLTRMRWIDDGESLVLGDRTLVALRPPTFDSPATRGLFDTRSRVYYASDSFGTAVPHHVDVAGDLPGDAWMQGFVAVNSMLSPWVGLADARRFADSVKAVESLDAGVVVSCHGPVITGNVLTRAYETMKRMPELSKGPMPPLPGQAELEAIVAAMTAEDS